MGLRAAATLRQVGLAFDEAGRLRTLAPIREHVASAHPPEPADLERAIGHYCQLAATVGWQVGAEGGAEAAERILAETSNLIRMLDQAITSRRLGDVVDAVVGLVEYMRFTGTTLPGLLEAARTAVNAAGDDAQCARLFRALGEIALARSDRDTAQARYEEALPLFRRVGDVRGEANCIRGLGRIAQERSDHDTAHTRYEEALALYEQIQEPYSISWAQYDLSDLASPGPERDQHLAAAREAWATINRSDLVHMLDEESGSGDEDR